MEIRSKYPYLAAVGLVALGLFVLISPSKEARGWTSTTGSVSAILGSGQVNPSSVEVDASGNIYYAGAINNATDFDPLPASTYTLTPASSNFTGFVSKLNSDGELVWAGLITGTGQSRITDISLDSSGNVLVIGHYSGSVDLDPSAGTINVQSSSSGAQTNLFAIRLTPSGTVTWSHTLPVLSYAYSADVDSSNNFVITGEFAGSNVDFDPSANTDTLTNGGNGIFVWSIASSGTHRWAKRAVGNSNVGRSVATDSSGNVYICGTYQGATTDFDPGSGTANESSSSNGQDFFLWSLNQNGSYRWVKTFGNSNPESCTDLDVSASGNVVVSGSFYTSIDIGRDSSNELTAISGEDYFFGLFDSSGTNLWIYAYDAIGQVVYISGTSVWLSGQFSGTADFNPDAGVTNNLVSRGSSDAYLVELNTSGAFQRAFRFGGSSGMETVNRMTVSGGNIYVAGYFGSTPSNFNPGSGTAINVSATGVISGYVNKLTSIGEVIVPPTTTTTTTTVPAATTTTPSVATTTAPSSSGTTTPAGTTPTTSPASSVTTAPQSQNTIAGGTSSSGGQSTQPTVTKSVPVQTSSATTTVAESAQTTTTVTQQSDVPDVDGVGSSEAGATVGGKPAQVVVTDENGSIVVTVGEATVRYSVTGPAGVRRVLASTSAAEVQPGDTVTIEMSGFATDADATAWLVPGDIPLGSVTLTAGSGAITGKVPNDATAGVRRIVATSQSVDDEPLVVAYGVEVADTSGAGPSWSLVFLIFLALAAIGGLLVPAVRRRRDDED